MKKHLIHLLSFALVFGFYTSVQAQAVRNTVERAADRNQIQRDKATIDRDRAEITQFRGYRNGMQNAIDTGNPALAKGHHAKLVNAMQREIAQGEDKIKLAKGELAQSRSEVRSDNREIRGNRATDARPAVRADDRRDRRDDIRDRADDRDDLAELKARNARQKEIFATYQSIKITDGPNAFAAVKAKHNLLDEFEQTMIRDMGENWEELNEDKRELREDRRETREDRRQR